MQSERNYVKIFEGSVGFEASKRLSPSGDKKSFTNYVLSCVQQSVQQPDGNPDHASAVDIGIAERDREVCASPVLFDDIEFGHERHLGQTENVC